MSLDPLPKPKSTLAKGKINSEYEDFLLGDAIGGVPFSHWTAHLRFFWGWYSEEPDFNCAEGDLSHLQQAISEELHTAGYPDLAREISAAGSAAAINTTIFAQYTNETSLYGEVNAALRQAHTGASLRGHPLSAWMLQFNSALRLRSDFDGPAYRGVYMTSNDIDQYQLGLMFEWAAFVSASKYRDTALDYRGSVLFDITPGGSYSMYAKRNPFDIAEHSTFPGEQEVVFPIACTYRVTNIRKDGRRSLISLETVDQY
jgi:hypothetical protein